MKRWIRGLASLASAIVTSGYVVPAAAAEYVYVESNIQTPNGNSIFAYSRGDDGTLTPVPGSPFLTGGTGVQDTSFVFGPYDSDQNIVIDRTRNLLYAVNSGSDTIAVFKIAPNGALSPIAGSPFPSGGTDPVSLAIAGDILFVVNQNGDLGRLLPVLPNYTTLHIESNGALTSGVSSANRSRPVNARTSAFFPPGTFGGSTRVELAWGSSPSQAYLVPGTNLMFGADFRAGLLQSFRYDSAGRLYQRQPVALPQNPNIPTFISQDFRLAEFPLGLTTHPHAPVLYVGFVVTSQLGVYRYAGNGALDFVRTVPNSGLAICWLRTNAAGTRLYTSNNGVVGDPVHDPFSTISVYDVTVPDAPVEIQNIQLKGFGNASQIELSSDEKFLYVVGQRATGAIPAGQGNALHVFSILPDGKLEEKITPIPLNVPVGTQPQGLAVYRR